MAYSQLSYDPWENTPQERKARIVGREALLQQIMGAVAEQHEHETVQHYLLLGPRGIGKTTLLLTLREAIQENAALSARWFCVQLREEEYFVRTLRDLLELTLQSLAEDAGLPAASEALRRVRLEKTEDRSLAVAVDSLREITAGHGKRILLLMDNFDRVFPATPRERGKKRASESEFRALRKLLSTERFLMVVGGSTRLFQEIAAYDRAFFNFFSPIEVPELSPDEICELMRRCAEAEGNAGFLSQFEALRSKIRAITFMTGGNPRLVLMLYDVLRQHEMTPVVHALRETVGGLTPLLKSILDDMPRQQSKTLDALLRLRGAAAPSKIAETARLPLNVVTTQLGRLKDARFVVSDGEGKGKPATYRISDPMFQTWYQMRYLRPAGRRVELFVEFIRAWFSVEDRRQFLARQWEVFGSVGTGKGRYQDTCRMIEYYAATLEDEHERSDHFARLADSLLAVGKEREAALLVAESLASPGLNGKQLESEGYKLLGLRRLAANDFPNAIAVFRKALKKDPGNLDTAMGLGCCLFWVGDYESAIETFEITLRARGLTAKQTAAVILVRALAKDRFGDHAGAIGDYTSVIAKDDAPIDVTTMALSLRGSTKDRLGDSKGAIADYTVVIGMIGAPVDHVAAAQVNRGLTKGSSGDRQGEIADYTAVVAMEGAPASEVAKAVFYRGLTKGSSGDRQGAIEDFTAAIEMLGTPANVRSGALLGRGLMFMTSGDIDRALDDFESGANTPGVSDAVRAAALAGCGDALFRLNRTAEGITRMTQSLELRASALTTHFAFSVVVWRLTEAGRVEEAAGWMARLHEFEASGTPIEPRVEVRIKAIVGALQAGAPTAAVPLLKAALTSGPEDVRTRLEFLSPAVQYARTADEKVLAGLSEREREAAKQIAGSLLRIAGHGQNTNAAGSDPGGVRVHAGKA